VVVVEEESMLSRLIIDFIEDIEIDELLVDRTPGIIVPGAGSPSTLQ